MRHRAILEQRDIKKTGTIQQRYSKEELKKLGAKNHTVQGMADILDINKLVKKITPEQIRALREKQMNGNYGTQSTDTIRDVLMKANELKKDFSTLPAMLREHFKNDEFAYLDFVEKNKDNKYALNELQASISKSDSYKNAVEQLKLKEKYEAEDLVLQQQKLKDLIKEAVSPASNPDGQ